MSQKKWKDFEYSTYEAAKKLNHGKTVKPNQYVKGKISGGRRQIDVKVEDYDFIDIECKDHKEKIDVTKVEQFANKLKDEGAKSGIIVSNSEFTEPAVKTAKHYGIELKHLVDIGHGDKSLFNFEAPVLMKGLYVRQISIGVENKSLDDWVLPQDLLEMVVQVGDEQITAYEHFRNQWNNKSDLIKRPGTYQLVYEDAPVVDYNGKPIRFDKVTYIYQVGEVYRLGRMGIQKGRGFYDVQNHTLHSSDDMTFEPLNLDNIEDWPKLTKEEADKMQVNFGFTMTARLPENPYDNKPAEPDV